MDHQIEVESTNIDHVTGSELNPATAPDFDTIQQCVVRTFLISNLHVVAVHKDFKVEPTDVPRAIVNKNIAAGQTTDADFTVRQFEVAIQSFGAQDHYGAFAVIGRVIEIRQL